MEAAAESLEPARLKPLKVDADRSASTVSRVTGIAENPAPRLPRSPPHVEPGAGWPLPMARASGSERHRNDHS
jgi:hypothetical protein